MKRLILILLILGAWGSLWAQGNPEIDDTRFGGLTYKEKRDVNKTIRRANQNYLTGIANAAVGAENAEAIENIETGEFDTISIYQSIDTVDTKVDTLKELVFNVVDYGAAPNGSSYDDTTGINLAIRTAFEGTGVTYGGTVYFPHGRYLISGPIIMKSHIKLQFAGGVEIYYPSGYEGPLILFPDGETQTEFMIEGNKAHFKENSPRSYLATGVKIYQTTSGSYATYSGVIQDLVFEHPAYGMDIYVGNNGWANDLDCPRMVIQNFRVGLRIRNDESGGTTMVRGCKFEDWLTQAGVYTEIGIDTCDARDCSFNGFRFWDYHVSDEDLVRSFYMSDYSKRNSLIGLKEMPILSGTGDEGLAVNLGDDNTILDFNDGENKISPGMVIAGSNSNDRDSINQLFIIGNGRAGTSTTPLGYKGLFVKSYRSDIYGDPDLVKYQTNCSGRFAVANTIYNDYASVVALQFHGPLDDNSQDGLVNGLIINGSKNGAIEVASSINDYTDTDTSDDAYEIDIPTITTLTHGLTVTFEVKCANTGTATLEITSVGLVDTIHKHHDQELETGDIEAGQIVDCVWDGVYWQMTSQLAQ